MIGPPLVAIALEVKVAPRRRCRRHFDVGHENRLVWRRERDCEVRRAARVCSNRNGAHKYLVKEEDQEMLLDLIQNEVSLLKRRASPTTDN